MCGVVLPVGVRSALSDCCSHTQVKNETVNVYFQWLLFAEFLLVRQAICAAFVVYIFFFVKDLDVSVVGDRLSWLTGCP